MDCTYLQQLRHPDCVSTTGNLSLKTILPPKDTLRHVLSGSNCRYKVFTLTGALVYEYKDDAAVLEVQWQSAPEGMYEAPKVHALKSANTGEERNTVHQICYCCVLSLSSYL